jgi:formate dehydrogenase major subunit
VAGVRQLTGADPLGRGLAARSKATENVVSRTATADRVVQSVCPYCAVGCGQRIYVKDEQIVQIEGDPTRRSAAAGCAPRAAPASSWSPARPA